MIVVLDTNVVVSAFMNPAGRPAMVLRLAATGTLRVAHDPRIMREYREVLARPWFGFPSTAVEILLDEITHQGVAVSAPPLNVTLPDPDDQPFLEVATAAGAALVTGNRRHFPSRVVGAVPVLTPAELLLTLAGR
ncbi:MAG: putative toxin-antitoxin system toxin component, PIN family [Deltaproteobacteria bacterium]|nr:putative toxin-antitoxin system toxin component, PIN family [Deltaproteobacteria bacterium]